MLMTAQINLNRTPVTQPQRRRFQVGFTLIELLVAISILAIVAVLGWRGLDSIVRARIALTSNLDQTRAMQLTFAQMQSDCAQAVPDHSRLLLIPPLTADQGRVTMVRYVRGEDEPTRMQVVAYRIRDGMLTRYESIPTRDLNMLTDAWQAANADANAAQALVLQSDVTAMTMRIWQNGAFRTPLPAAEAAANPTLPSGLEVALQLRGRSTSMLKIFLLGSA
jgi:general secretion pathway protein J